MAYVTQRGARFTGYYRDNRGKKYSAGTFDTRDEALKTAERAEQAGGEGQYRLTTPLSEYVETWVKTADLLPLTKKNYILTLRTHVLPYLGKKPVGQISRADVRQMLDSLRIAGKSAALRRQAKASLGSALQELVELDQLDINPTHKISIKSVQETAVRDIISPTEFKQIIQSLPTPSAQLFAQTLIATGLRFGEATELRVKDFNPTTQELYVQRRVTELGAQNNNGDRFQVIAGTKSGRRRIVTVSVELSKLLSDHIAMHEGFPETLLFSKAVVLPPQTMPSRTTSNFSGHLPKDSWRRMWKTAVHSAGLDWLPRTHDLRHANATTLLKNGVDLHEVKERLGHSSIRTTEVYLHRLKHQQSKASQAVAEFL
jgi:integrase